MAHADDDSAPFIPARIQVIRAGSASTKPLRPAWGRIERLAGRADNVETLVVDRLIIDPFTPPVPFHLHRHTATTFLVLSGELEVGVEAGAHRLRTGDAVFLPAGLPHRTHNPSDLPASVLAIYERSVDHDFVLSAEEPAASVRAQR